MKTRRSHVSDQKLGLQGASTLADVLKTSSTLEELHCENNDIPLSGFTDLVNALHRNTTLTYLPAMQESRQMALKQTEDQVKQMRDDGSLSPVKNSSVRAKITNKVVGKSSKDKTLPMHLSNQDIKAALGLVDESWDRQIYRLEQYLRRNYNIAHGIPTAMEVDDEEFERPDTATSLRRVIEKVKYDSTPTIEKQVCLGELAEESQSEAEISLAKEIEMSLAENRAVWSQSRFQQSG